ncbi:MAG: hypothetical protein FWC47_17755 [Oscillospiraceae bacterium]|nr:hypothetical protein [Oscillospiraceae bacterium]
MIHEIHSNLSLLRLEFEEIFSFLYQNPELSFEENQCINFLCDKLSKYGFETKKDFMDVKNCFLAEIGSGHPKIGLIFDMDASFNGHTKGNNLSSGIMCCVGILMSRLKDSFNGSICLFGSSGENACGTKITLLKQGAFSDIDYMISIMPYTKNCVDILTPSSTSYSIKFLNENADHLFKNHMIKIIDFINHQKDISVCCEKLTNSLEDALLSIEFRSNKYLSMDDFEDELEDFLGSEFKDMKVDTCYYDMPYCQLKNDETLKKIIITNLKQSGIINFEENESIDFPLSLGNVSTQIPTYVAVIDVCENKDVKFDTKEFYQCTNSFYAKEQSYKVMEAISLSIGNIMNIS